MKPLISATSKRLLLATLTTCGASSAFSGTGLEISATFDDHTMDVQVHNTSNDLVTISKRMVVGPLIADADLQLDIQDSEGNRVYMSAIVDSRPPKSEDMIRLPPGGYFGQAFNFCDKLFPYDLQPGTYRATLSFRAYRRVLGSIEETTISTDPALITISGFCKPTARSE